MLHGPLLPLLTRPPSGGLLDCGLRAYNRQFDPLPNRLAISSRSRFAFVIPGERTRPAGTEGCRCISKKP